MDTQIIHNFLNNDEVGFLLSYYDSKPYTSERTTEYQNRTIILNRNKNSDYDQPTSLVHQLLGPKLKKLLGPHVMDSGSLLESHYPYSMHLDTHDTFEDRQFYLHNKKEKCLDIAVLISLNEDPSFKTVMFDYFSDTIELTQIPNSQNNNIVSNDYSGIDLSHFTQQQLDFVKNLKISNVYNWSLGGLVIWPRRQLHCSSNFYSSGKQKKAIVLFL
jgi:hypothetical protein